MSNTQMLTKTTSPDEVGANNLAKKKLSRVDMFKKYLTSPGKAINLFKNNGDFNNELNNLLKKPIVNNEINENMKISDLIDANQIMIYYPEFKKVFEIIKNQEDIFLKDDSLKKIFTQTRDSKGTKPSNYEVFLNRFLIINICNIDIFIHNYYEDFLQLIEFLFKIPYNYIEESVFFLSVVFDDLTDLIKKNILDPNFHIDLETNEFIGELSSKCTGYLMNEKLTDGKYFTTYEMQQFLQAHLVDQMKHFCPEKKIHLDHIVSALTNVSFDISKKDIHYFYDPLIKSTSDFILDTLQSESNNNVNERKKIIFLFMDKIFSISNEIYNEKQEKRNTSEIIELIQTLLIDYAKFIDFIIDTNEWVKSDKAENFTNFSKKEENLFNNDKNYKEQNSSIIESRDKKFVFDLTELSKKSFREDNFSIISNTCFPLNDEKFYYFNKFIGQMKKNKIVSMLILKELSKCILTQIKKEKTIKSASKMLIFIKILINILNDFSQEDFDKISDQQQIKEQIFSADLVENFVFDEKYFYFSNPTSKTYVLYYFLQHSNNDSIFNLTDQHPADIDRYEEIRKSILSLFCNHFQLLPTNFITLIMKKIEYSVQPQISNYFISMLRSFYYKWPDLTIEYMKSMSFFDYFVDNYLLRLRNYYIFYRKSSNNSFACDCVQMYRFNSLMFIIQLSKNPIHLQALFSSSKVVDYFLQYKLFEEDNCTLVIELIKLVIKNSNINNKISVSSECKITVNNITTSLIKTIENLTDSISKNVVVNDTKDQPFDYASYCLQLLHNILVMIGECLQTKTPVFFQSLINQNFPLYLCQIPNKIIPINSQLKLDIINDILYIICEMTKDNNEIKKRFIGPMKKYKLAELLNSIELNDKTIQCLLMLIFEEEIKLSQNNDTDSDQSQKKLIYIKFNKALPFIHIALLDKPQYKQIFTFIYEITFNSFTNKIQIYRSKLLSLFISEIQKYSDITKITNDKLESLDLMFNIYNIVTSCLAKPQTLIEVLKALQKKDNNEMPWYASKFIRNFNIILENESNENKKNNNESGSTSFYHFNGHKTGISIPQFSIADKKNFSYVCRFQLHKDYEKADIKNPTFLSFSVNNYQIKLFFKQNKFYIKLKNKTTKKKTESEVGFSFISDKWYTLVLIGKSNDKLELYMDGTEQAYTESHINFLFDTFSSFVVANSSLEKDKGLSCNISVIYFFNQAISIDKIKDLNSLNYKFTYLFTPSNLCLYSELPKTLFDEKFEKSLIFCYNSNMFDGHSAINLVRGTSTTSEVNGLNVPYNSSFIGAIASLGGIKAFLPLIEIVDSHPDSINKSDENNYEQLITIIGIFTFLNKLSSDFENEFCNSNGIQAFAHIFSKISKSNIDKFVLSSLYYFYISFRKDTNKETFLKLFWFNYNIWAKLTLEQFDQVLLPKYEELFKNNEELFKKCISYQFLLLLLKDIKDENVREKFFSFVEFYSQHYFVKQDQKFMLHFGFASEGVFQGQIMKLFYTIIEKGNECFNRLNGTGVYNNLIALSSSSNEETRIYAIKMLVWMKNKNKKEQIPLNISILSFIKTLNYENITDRTWNELEKSIFVENKISERIIELLPLFSSYSHYSDPKLSHDFIQKLHDITNNNYENYKKILLSPNWTLNLFYIYLNSKKPIIDFSEKDTIVDFFENMLLFLIKSQNIGEYRNILNEFYLIQFIHYFDVSLLLRQIFISILKRKETESPNIYKIILPDVFMYLFYLPAYNVGTDVFPFQSSFDHSNQDLNWTDFIRCFNFHSQSISRKRSSICKDDTVNTSNSDIDIDLTNKIKVDLSSFKGSFAIRITRDGKWSDLELVIALSKQFENILNNLKEKQVDKFMTISGHNSFELSLSCYDFFVIIEMICINLGVKEFDRTIIIPLLCSRYLRNSPDKKQSLCIICHLALQTIDEENRADFLDEFINKFIKPEFQKEGAIPMNKYSQTKFLEYISKEFDLFDLFDSIDKNCIEYFKNIKDITVLAKSSLEMIHQESHNLIPRTVYVKQFTDQYPLVLLNMKNICLSAYQKISKEIISYENSNKEKTNLHWKISKRIDKDLRHIYYKINNHFDYDKYKKLAKSANEKSQSASNQENCIFQISSKRLDIDTLDLDDNDDDDYNTSDEVNNNEIDEDKENITQQNSNEGVESLINIPKENTIFKAVLIMVSKQYSGKLSINENEITFTGKEMDHLMKSTAIPDKYLNEKKKKKKEINDEETNQESTSNTKTIQFRLSDIFWFLLRNYLHVKEGFEVFLVNCKSYFFFLTEFNRKSLIKLLTKYQKSLTNCKIFQTSQEQISKIIQETKIVEDWINGKISNYNYLVTLNLLAGRSFNDTTQYPVFPWILKEYDKEEIDLEDESIYRDLSRPINTLGEGRLEQLIDKYNEIDENDVEIKYHNGIFYSNDTLVSIYLIRAEPFTTAYINTQHYFDLPRFPRSISKLYTASTHENGCELIPEYFTTPEVFVNNDNDIVYGNNSYNKMELPKWCIDQNPYDFVKKHRLALESDYVSNHLNQWIDLIFGSAQFGEEAVKRYNTYPPKLYSKYLAEHKSEIKKEPSLFEEVQEFIFNFGIVPDQIFKTEHPQKVSRIEKMALFYTNKFSNILKSLEFSDASTLKNLIANYSTQKQIPLFTATNKSMVIVLSSDSKLFALQLKSSLSTNYNEPKSRLLKQVSTDLSKFVLLKNDFLQTAKPSAISTTKGFVFLSDKLVVTSPLDPEIKIFQIRQEDFNIITESQNSKELTYQECSDLTYQKPQTGSCVFGLYSTIQLPDAVLMTCKAGEDEFLSVSSNFSIIKWSFKESNDDKINNETTTTNNHEFGSKIAEKNNEQTALKSKIRRKSSANIMKIRTPTANIVKMVYRIIPHSTKIIAIDACNKINLIASCDKEKNLTLSRLNDGAFIRSFKTPYKAKSLIVSKTPCIVVSQISKNVSREKDCNIDALIETFALNNNKNYNSNEEPIAKRVFERKTLTAWCEIDKGLGFDNYLTCCFDDKTLVILSLPMLDVVHEELLVENATHATFNRDYSALVVACKNGCLYKLKC